MADTATGAPGSNSRPMTPLTSSGAAAGPTSPLPPNSPPPLPNTTSGLTMATEATASTFVTAATAATLSSTIMPRSSIAVGLNEAALDSPSFRSTAVQFADQLEAIERWLEAYVKSTSKLVHDCLALEESINTHLSKISPPAGVADGVIDADFTLLALKRISDGSREWWTGVLNSLRRLDIVSAEPIRAFLNGDLKTFKETRRSLDTAQKTYDTTLGRYVGQSKTKEPSSLREDAFAVYETRRVYLKASLDFCQMAPQVRCGLDKLLTRVSADFWREMKRSRSSAAASVKWGDEMERIRGWSKELELSEAALRRELQVSRREIGETTLATIRPSRELDDYSASTVAFLGSRGPAGQGTAPAGLPSSTDAVISEKQGWLYYRTVTGKPARVNWVRRWFYCRDGIFGWLVPAPQGVLQGDDIGVLLCSAKPAVQEERRFCFEVKTKSQNMMMQAETQSQLTEWLEVFEVAKKKAFEDSMARDNASGDLDPAFAITPPSVPEFSARALETAGAQLGTVDETSVSLERTTTALPLPGDIAPRGSFDVSAAPPPRRSITMLGRELQREEGESSREHAARIMQRLEMHRKATFSSGSADAGNGIGANGLGSASSNALLAAPQPGGGIASLITASHGIFPGYPINPLGVSGAAGASRGNLGIHTPNSNGIRSKLAPITLAKSPISTILSKVAVIASSERGINRVGVSGGLPAGVLANYWGSNLWGGYVSKGIEVAPGGGSLVQGGGNGSSTTPLAVSRKGSVAAGGANSKSQDRSLPEEFPPDYPSELKAQHAQFRLLFPAVPLEEKLVLVFNAAWVSASEEGKTNQGLFGSGRVYVSADNMYFYSQTMGLVVTYAVSLDIISEVTAAPGKECDYTFLHLGQDTNETGFTRITIKTFLDDMYLLQARLNLLIDDLQAAEPMSASDIVVALENLDSDFNGQKSPSVESWEEISANTPIDNGTPTGRPVARRPHGHADSSNQRYGGRTHIHRGAGVYGYGGFGGRAVPKVQLPSHPVMYEPDDMQKKVVERHFEISAKACFHVLFGDKSFIFPKLYSDRRARDISQGPWSLRDHGKMKRQFHFTAETFDMLGRTKNTDVTDEQTIDIFSDHVTYVVRHVRTAWHLPHAQNFKQVIKVVITHVAKSKCKLAIYTKIEWSNPPPFSRSIVERQALDDASHDVEELAETATDEIRKLGAHSRTKRAIQVYGNIGQQSQTIMFTPGEGDASGNATKKQPIKPRTLTDMVIETLRSFMESVVSSLVMWTIAAIRKLFHVASAHRIILAVLALSLAANLVFSSRETASWWTERNAAHFMSRLGVGPHVMMSKSVYLVDLEAASQTGTGRATPNGSVCYDTFSAIANTTDLDAPFEQAGSLLSAPTNRATAQRLRRTRQKLGTYRHDLLVAMRVVNSVEREMVQSEWENWLADENARCDQMKVMLDAKRASSNNSSTVRAQTQSKKAAPSPGNGKQAATPDDKPVDEKRLALLAGWYDSYCGSCRADQTALEGAAWRQSMV